jgi:hypothetical protein
VIEGSCLCGGVRFEIDEDKIFLFNNCHCTWCRKVTGAAFGSFLQIVPGTGFRWISGQELVATFESSPGNHRAFCKVCGSRAPQSRNWAEHVTVPAGSLERDPGVAPDVNIYIRSRVGWNEIDPSIPSFPDAGPPEFWGDFVRNKRP